MKIEVSDGEIVDKFTILKIKLKHAPPFSQKYFNILEEYDILKVIVKEMNLDSSLIEELENINNSLWKIEDDIRLMEKEKQFNQSFIELARSVYLTNDKRFEVKNKINILRNSKIKEEKILPNYGT